MRTKIIKSETLAVALRRDIMVSFCERNRIRSLSLFGSEIHSKTQSDKEFDFLVDFEPSNKVSLFELSYMELELSDMLHVSIKLRTDKELNPACREQLLEEKVYVYKHG